MKAAFQSPDLRDDEYHLAKIALTYCLLPSRAVVKSIGGPVFPTIRNRGKRIETGYVNGRRVMYDDNTTPRWALLWTHGYTKVAHPKGWTFAHVWDESGNPEAYTHLANLVMMPECFASLSDKLGPLVSYLRYHSQSVYQWRPEDRSSVEKPERYDQIEWNYFEPIPDPGDAVRTRLTELNNQRVIKIRKILGIQP